MDANVAKDILLRTVANFPGLYFSDHELNGGDLVEWLSNELFHCGIDRELAEFAINGTPENYKPLTSID